MNRYQIVVEYLPGFHEVRRIERSHPPELRSAFDGGTVIQIQHWLCEWE